jgi:exosortase C (VPDSG-CTERM-specific)
METEKIIRTGSNAGNPPFSPVRDPLPMGASRQWPAFFGAATLLVVCFSVPLIRLARFALNDELYSYIVLVPFISWYLIHQKRKELHGDSRPWRGAGWMLAAVGTALMTCRFLSARSGPELALGDDLALVALAFVLLVAGAAFVFLGRETMRVCGFPFAMLVFLVPMPVFVRDGIENFLQYGSAYVADGMFRLSGMTFMRMDLVFILPTTPIHVAPECSGIHSSLILFITSLIAAYLFLRTTRSRFVLVLAVLPLALLRNGFRIWTIGELCVHYGAQMLDSPIHRKGGPLFFVLSLIPFFALLVLLRRWERRQKNRVSMEG